jgi:hypothetical protein
MARTFVYEPAFHNVIILVPALDDIGSDRTGLSTPCRSDRKCRGRSAKYQEQRQIDTGCGSDTCGESGFWKGRIMYLRGIYSCQWLKQSQRQREIQKSGCKIIQRIVVTLTEGKVGHGETFSATVSGRLSPEQRSLSWYKLRNSMESYRACASLSTTGIASIYTHGFSSMNNPSAMHSK